MTSQSISEEAFQQAKLSNRSFRFGGHKATSQAIVWPILFLLSLNISSSGLTDSPEARLIVLRVTVAALFCAGIYFTILGAVIDSAVPQLGKLRTSLVAFLYGTTEIVRAALIQIFAGAYGLEINPQW